MQNNKQLFLVKERLPRSHIHHQSKQVSLHLYLASKGVNLVITETHGNFDLCRHLIFNVITIINCNNILSMELCNVRDILYRQYDHYNR